MKIYYCHELQCVYHITDAGELEYTDLSKDSVFDTEGFDFVDVHGLKDEPVRFQGRETTFSEVYRHVEKVLAK